MTDTPDRENPVAKEKGKKAQRIGITFLILSVVFYIIAVLILPLTSFPADTKVIIVGVFAVVGEVLFWVGGFIVGRELMKKYRSYLNPLRWFKK